MLFKFTTVKPPASKIWEEISELKLKPTDGYTVNQIKYILFIVLQLDFLDSREMVNNCITKKNSLFLSPLIIKVETLGILREHILGIKDILSDHLPHMVDESLYLPYYYTMQVGSEDLVLRLMSKLFDRETIDIKETNYIKYCVANDPALAITKANWDIDQGRYNDYIINHYNSIFRIDNTQVPVVVTNKQDIQNILFKYITYNLNYDSYYDYSNYIHIPPFKLEEAPNETL